MSEKSVTAVEFGKQLSEGNVQLVDVRTPVEFREVHVEGAVNVPLDRLSVDKVPSCSETEPLYVVCHQGGRGVQACKQLTSLGLVNVVNVEGGTTACVEAGLPVVHGEKNDVARTPSSCRGWVARAAWRWAGVAGSPSVLRSSGFRWGGARLRRPV